jgi:hypothetical protein
VGRRACAGKQSAYSRDGRRGPGWVPGSMGVTSAGEKG